MTRKRFLSLLILFTLLLLNSLWSPVSAQDTPTAVTTDNVKVRGGSDKSNPQIGSLAAGATVVLEARNQATTWTLIHTPDSSLRGWVAAAYLAPSEGVRLSDLPVSEELMPAQEYSVLDQLRVTSIVPGMTNTALTIYQHGLELGNNPNHFSKVGDCQNIPEFFLGAFDRGEYNLGSYSDLQATIDYFAGSFGRDSESADSGFNVYTVLDPAWATEPCRGGESPQQCEYRLWTPSFVVISLEITSGITVEGYESALREILDFWIGNGVVPILGTKADNREGDWSFNATIAELSWEYDIPLWNFMMAAQPLSDFGLTDGFHLTYAGNDFSNPDNMLAAWPWRNLTALQTLDVMRRAVS